MQNHKILPYGFARKCDLPLQNQAEAGHFGSALFMIMLEEEYNNMQKIEENQKIIDQATRLQNFYLSATE